MTEDLPQNWDEWSLEEVGEWCGGGTPSSTNAAFWNGHIPWVSPKDMKVNKITTSQDTITQAALVNSAAKLIPAHSVLFVTRSGILAHSFPVATNQVAVTVNQDMKAITPVTAVEPEYLTWLLRFSARNILNTCSKHGTTVHSIEIPALKRLKIPIPPPNEQRRIIAKIEELLSELDKAVESLSTARDQLAVYRQSILKHAFEGKITEAWRGINPLVAPDKALKEIQIERKDRKGKKSASRFEKREGVVAPQVPEEWALEYLGDLNLEVFDGPFGSNLKTSDYVETGVRVIRLENIGYGNFIDEKKSFVSRRKYEAIQKHTVVPSDIVFSSFVIDAIRSALVPANISFAVNKADCFGVRFFGKTVDPKFIQFFFQSRNAFKQMEGLIHGVGRPRINTTQLKEMLVPLCSPAEQAVIVEELESIFSDSDSIEATLDSGLAQVAALRHSILKQAFSGQLVAQDPTEEPASELLKRVRIERSATQKPERKTKKISKAKETAA